MKHKETSYISDLQRAKKKKDAGWEEARFARHIGSTVKDVINIVKAASQDYLNLTKKDK